MFSGGNKDKTSTMRESTRPFYTTKKLSLNDDKEKEKKDKKDENKKTEDQNVNKNQELTKKIDNNKNQNTQVQTQKNEKEEEFKKRNTMPLSYASKIVSSVEPQKNEKKEEKPKNTPSPQKNVKPEEKPKNSPVKQKNVKPEEKPKEKPKEKSQNTTEVPVNNNSKPEENEDEYKSEELEREIFLEGISYEKYLAKLSSQNKKEYELERESFCEGFFIASFPQKNGQVIENSQSFPSPCGHSECSELPAMKPEIIVRYPLIDTKTLELNNLAATICFPTGIKVCYSEESPSMINDYVTPITNQKGERYYMVTFHFYHKIMNDIYGKLYEMHPLKHHLMKFGDSFLDMSEEEMDENITNQIQESLHKSEQLGFRDYVYVPYCICLISNIVMSMK